MNPSPPARPEPPPGADTPLAQCLAGIEHTHRQIRAAVANRDVVAIQQAIERRGHLLEELAVLIQDARLPRQQVRRLLCEDQELSRALHTLRDELRDTLMRQGERTTARRAYRHHH